MASIVVTNPTFMQRVHTGVEKTIEGAATVKKDGHAFYSALKFGNYALLRSGPVSPLRHALGAGLAVFDAFDLPASIHYWLNGDWREDTTVQILANATLGLATIGGFVLWLEELGFYALGIGCGLGTAVLGLVSAGYGFLAIDAIQNIMGADNPQKRTKGILDLISSVAYVALFILLAIPAMNLWVLAVFGVVAAGFGLTSFLYKHFNQEAF